MNILIRFEDRYALKLNIVTKGIVAALINLDNDNTSTIQ